VERDWERVRYIVVRTNPSGAASHPQATLKQAVLLAVDFIADANGAFTTSIIDVQSQAIFCDSEIQQFAERFAQPLKGSV
jgi:hypothetical protein